MWRDMERLCNLYNFPLRRPSKFPRNGLRPSRIISAHPEATWVPDFARAVFKAGFAEDQDIGDSLLFFQESSLLFMFKTNRIIDFICIYPTMVLCLKI